jgi:abortive infection bacteriophage resistance protein
MKSAKTTLEFIELLKSRGLIFADEHKAECFLFQNNYYRLSGYWRKYQINPDEGDDIVVPLEKNISWVWGIGFRVWIVQNCVLLGQISMPAT